MSPFSYLFRVFHTLLSLADMKFMNGFFITSRKFESDWYPLTEKSLLMNSTYEDLLMRMASVLLFRWPQGKRKPEEKRFLVART